MRAVSSTYRQLSCCLKCHNNFRYIAGKQLLTILVSGHSRESDTRRSFVEEFMFEGYTMNQLLDLRSLCIVTIESADDVHKRADTLLLLEYIDEELAIREHKQSA
jgi:hypothetical protein